MLSIDVVRDCNAPSLTRLQRIQQVEDIASFLVAIFTRCHIRV